MIPVCYESDEEKTRTTATAEQYVIHRICSKMKERNERKNAENLRGSPLISDEANVVYIRGGQPSPFKLVLWCCVRP